MNNKTTNKITNITKTTKPEKLNCPVCQTKIRLKTDTKSKIIICPSCDNSLFMYSSKKAIIPYPFSLNVGFKGDKLIPEEELENYGFDPYDDDIDDEDDFD